MITETIQPDTAMPTVRIMPKPRVESMQIKSAEVVMRCMTCPATIQDHADLLFFEDASDFEANVRANSDWATGADPGGWTCPKCQADDAAATKAQQERI